MWRTKARESVSAKPPWTEEPCGSIFWPDEQDEHKIYLYALNKDCPELMCVFVQKTPHCKASVHELHSRLYEKALPVTHWRVVQRPLGRDSRA